MPWVTRVARGQAEIGSQAHCLFPVRPQAVVLPLRQGRLSGQAWGQSPTFCSWLDPRTLMTQSQSPPVICAPAPCPVNLGVCEPSAPASKQRYLE